MTDDALAKVKAARALYIPKPQLADGFYLNADIDALVREVEAGRLAADFIRYLDGLWDPADPKEAYRQATFEAYDAARKGDPSE